MVKKRVDLYIPKAYKVLQKVGIAKDDIVNAGYRSQIASFGAMIAMGSILSAVALFSAKKSKASVDRVKLMQAIYAIITDETGNIPENSLFEYVKQEIKKGHINSVTEDIKDAAIALKLAINLYQIADDKGDEKNEKLKKEEDNAGE